MHNSSENSLPTMLIHAEDGLVMIKGETVLILPINYVFNIN